LWEVSTESPKSTQKSHERAARRSRWAAEADSNPNPNPNPNWRSRWAAEAANPRPIPEHSHSSPPKYETDLDLDLDLDLDSSPPKYARNEEQENNEVGTIQSAAVNIITPIVALKTNHSKDGSISLGLARAMVSEIDCILALSPTPLSSPLVSPLMTPEASN